MSYIVTYENDGKVDTNGVPYLRAKANDGIHGKHNTLFPKGAKAAKLGIPSRYDMNNVGVQIEVRNLTWVASGTRAGYYTVSESDIIGVVSSSNTQQNNPAPVTSTPAQPQFVPINWTTLKFGQLILLDPNVYTNCAKCLYNNQWTCIGYCDARGFIVYLDKTSKTYVAKHTISGQLITDDGNVTYDFINPPLKARDVAVDAGIIRDYDSKTQYQGSFMIQEFQTGTPSSTGFLDEKDLAKNINPSQTNQTSEPETPIVQGQNTTNAQPTLAKEQQKDPSVKTEPIPPTPKYMRRQIDFTKFKKNQEASQAE